MRHIPSPPPLWISNTLGLAEQNPAVCEHVHELGMGRLSPPEPSAEQTVLCLPKGFREPVAWGRFYFSDLDLPPAACQAAASLLQAGKPPR